MRSTAIGLSLGLVFAAVAGAQSAPTVVTPPPDIVFRSEHGQLQKGVRCAAKRPSAAEKDKVKKALAEFRKGGGGAPGATPTPGTVPGPGPNGEIPVVFHVVYSESKKGVREGDVPLVQIETQIDVLNAAYANTGFSFYLAGVNRVKNSTWFSGCYGGSEAKMKQALAVDPAHTLNVYTCKPSGGILGFAYYPWSFPETDKRHGVVLLYSSLPGGSAAPYNEGDTATHEVGHYLGLAHTFEGGCTEPGDSVGDTPAEQSAAYACPVGRDSCPAAGIDPIYNFMDYTDDACMNAFSIEQKARMTDLVSIYKPAL